jgi:preprotein translocase subunit YajC
MCLQGSPGLPDLLVAGLLFGEQGPALPFWPILIAIMIMFYFLMIRPEMASKKRHEEMLKSLKQGDQVVTLGGIIGRVVSVDQETVVLRVDDNTRLRVLRRAIAERVAEEKKTEGK